MTVVVSFMKPGFSINAPMISNCRVREDIALDGTTTAVAQDGEVALVGNAESSMIAVAFGTTPDPDATVATAATSAGIPVAAGGLCTLVLPVGAKVAAKAL